MDKRVASADIAIEISGMAHDPDGRVRSRDPGEFDCQVQRKGTMI
jgi:hypothetical protein